MMASLDVRLAFLLVMFAGPGACFRQRREHAEQKDFWALGLQQSATPEFLWAACKARCCCHVRAGSAQRKPVFHACKVSAQASLAGHAGPGAAAAEQDGRDARLLQHDRAAAAGHPSVRRVAEPRPYHGARGVHPLWQRGPHALRGRHHRLTSVPRAPPRKALSSYNRVPQAAQA